MIGKLIPIVREVGLQMRTKWGEDTKNYVDIAFTGSKRHYKYGTARTLKNVDWKRVRRIGIINMTADGDMNEFVLINDVITDNQK